MSDYTSNLQRTQELNSRLRERIAELEREVETHEIANSELYNHLVGTACVYCDWKSRKMKHGEDVQSGELNQSLRDHVVVCEKHLHRKTEAELKAMQDSVSNFCTSLGVGTLEEARQKYEGMGTELAILRGTVENAIRGDIQTISLGANHA